MKMREIVNLNQKLKIKRTKVMLETQLSPLSAGKNDVEGDKEVSQY